MKKQLENTEKCCILLILLIVLVIVVIILQIILLCRNKNKESYQTQDWSSCIVNNESDATEKIQYGVNNKDGTKCYLGTKSDPNSNPCHLQQGTYFDKDMCSPNVLEFKDQCCPGSK